MQIKVVLRAFLEYQNININYLLTLPATLNSSKVSSYSHRAFENKQQFASNMFKLNQLCTISNNTIIINIRYQQF